MLRERNQTFKMAFILLDLVVSFTSFVLAVIIHFYVLAPEKQVEVIPDFGGTFSPGGYFQEHLGVLGAYLPLGFLLTLAQVLVFISIDLYHPRRGLSIIKEVLAITRGVGISMVVVLAILFFYRDVPYSRKVILYVGVLNVGLHASFHYLFRRLLAYMRARGYNTRRVLVLGSGEAARRFVDVIQKHSIYGYEIVGVLSHRKPTSALLKPLIKGSVKDFAKKYSKLNPDMVVYAMPLDPSHLEQIIDFCDIEGVDCRIIPDMVDLITSRARLEDVDGMPILIIRDTPLRNGYNRTIKRGFDIVFSLLVILIASPILAMLALLVKLSSRGPIFFRQERIGLDRKIFHVFKFRTMVVQEKSKSDSTWGGKNDSRVTLIGRLLRKSSLDELPQFLNVLLGDMSVVGPRPERPHFVKEFKTKYMHYMRRHSVKAGITGWAQILGFRGDTSIEKRVEADIYYIENWSFWLDLSIVVKTIPALIRSPGE